MVPTCKQSAQEPLSLTSRRKTIVNHARDWVKSTKIGPNPILNQFLSRHRHSSIVWAVCHCPLSAQENRLWSCFQEVKERGMHPLSIFSLFENHLNSMMSLGQTRTSVVRLTPMNMSTGYSTCAFRIECGMKVSMPTKRRIHEVFTFILERYGRGVLCAIATLQYIYILMHIKDSPRQLPRQFEPTGIYFVGCRRFEPRRIPRRQKGGITVPRAESEARQRLTCPDSQ